MHPIRRRLSPRPVLTLAGFTGIAAVLMIGAIASSQAQTPRGLRELREEPQVAPPPWDWKRLGIRDWELRHLERFHRGDGYEAFHVGYLSLKLNMTGVLARPYIRDEETKYPLIVLNHGSEHGVSGGYRALALDLASRGYVVLAPTFRGRSGPEGRSEGLVEYGKGEVLDLLQLAQLGRKLDYVDSARMAIIGEGHGATTTVVAIERSNIFRVAVVISPAVFSAMPEYGYAGITRLQSMAQQLFGRELPRRGLVRELARREMLRNAHRITTPLLFITTDTDPSYRDQKLFLRVLAANDVPARLLDFPGMFPGFMTAVDNGRRPLGWHEYRDTAWKQIFDALEEHMPEPAEEEEEP